MVTIVERTEGHYEVRAVPYGKTYVWCPGCVVVECDCGERPSLTSSTTTCRCGADYTLVVREALAIERLKDEAFHPWRYTDNPKDAGLPF